MKKKRILALILSVAMLFGIIPKMQLLVNAEDTATVYVGGTNASDENEGTENAPFQTLAKAITVLEATGKSNQVVKVIGDYTLTASDGATTHSNMVTISGNDGNAQLTINADVYIKGGSLKLENIKLYYANTSVHLYCLGNELVLGDGITTAFPSGGGWWVQMPAFSSGGYSSTAKTYTKAHKVTVNSGQYYQMFLGDSVITTGTTRNIPGVEFTMNGGLFQTIYIGGNGWSENLGTNKYTDDVNIMINGGTINSNIRLFNADSRVNFNNHALQLICNNGMNPTLHADFTKENVEACGGTFYYIKCAAQSGSYLSTTDTAGTYTVNGDMHAIATDTTDSRKVYYSKDGKLTVPSGTYDVTWTSEVQTKQWNITCEEVEGTCIAPTDYENMFNVTTPAGKLAAAVDSKNNKVYVAEDKSVADKTPKTNYVSTKYTDWGCFQNNGTYLANTYKKLTEDKELKVVYFGGSLTNGYGCGQAGDINGLIADGVTRNVYSWRALSGKWLQDNFADATITTVDAAIGESGTFLGTYRVQADIIAQKPDLLFIEYAINDNYYGSSESEAALQFETIVREVKQALPSCDIITVLTTDKTRMSATYNGTLFNTAKGHSAIAEAYNLPVVNIGLGLAKNIADIESNTSWWTDDTIWKKYFFDTVHPFSTGHEQYYLCMEEFLENNLLYTDFTDVTTSRSNLPAVQSEYLLDGNRQSIFGKEMQTYFVADHSEGASFNGGTFVTGTSDTPREGYYEVTANGSITFKFTGTEFTVWSNLKNNFSYSVDGKATTAVNASTHAPTQVVEGLTSGEHTITITPSQAMQIAGIFVRDVKAQTTKGATYSYADYVGMTLTLPEGDYHVYYVETVGDLPEPDSLEGTMFVGWKDEKGNILETSQPLTKGMVLSAALETVCEVYVSSSGSDDNVGTKDAPFKTIAKAIAELDGSTSDNQVIKLIGTYECTDTDVAQTHSKIITITGDDTDSKLSFSASKKITGGSLKFEAITLYYEKTGIEMFCYGNELIIGNDVTTSFAASHWSSGQAKITTGTYNASKNYTQSHKLTVNSGDYYQLFLGDSVITTGATRNIPGVEFTMDGGLFQTIYVGGNGWTGNLGTNKYTDDVNLTINGGKINSNISLFYADNRVNFNSHALQLICNNGMNPTLNTNLTKENVEACGGTFYYIKCAAQSGSYLSTTDTAGTYTVHGELKAVATEANGNVYSSANGMLAVEPGTYTVTWELDDSPLNVFVDETNGIDTNDGQTVATAVKTLNKAVEMIQNSKCAEGTIKIVGNVTIDGTTQNNKLTAHSKMITIQGNDSTSVLYLKGKSLTTNGPLTVENITITLSADYIGFDSDTYEFKLGENITNKTTPHMRVEAGPNNADSEKIELTMNSGNLQQMLVGVFGNTDGTTNSIDGFDYVQNGGQLSAMLLGSNAWEASGTKFYSTAFTGNVNITLNGGQLREIQLLKTIAGSVSQQYRDLSFEAAVQIIINDKGYLASELPEFNAEGGLWVMNGHGSGYNLTVTETAGVYNVPEGVTAIAYSEDGSRTYVSVDGVLTVTEHGTYTVEYKEELDYTNSGTVIIFHKDVTNVFLADFAVKDMEDKLFVGWMNGDEAVLSDTTTFTAGTTLTARFIDFNMKDDGDFFIKGTQIRKSGEAMRIVMQLGTAVSEQLKDVECGSVYILNKQLGTGELVKDGSYFYDGETHTAQAAVGSSWKTLDKAVQYTVSIDNIATKDYQLDYAIKGYLTYTDLNGVSRTVYTNELVTGVNDTAEKLLEIDAEDASLLKIIAAGKVAMQAMYSGENAVTSENIVKGTIGSNFNGGTINGTNGEVAMIYNQLDNGLTVRNVTIDAVNGNASDEATTVVQISDPHFNYCNSEDIAEGNPSTMSTWENRHLNKLWHTNSDQWMTPIYNFANSLEYAKAYGDQTVITGDVVDYISNGTLALMKRYINAPYSDALVTLGNHDPIRVMGLSTDVPDVTSLDSRYNLLKANWNNDVYYTSKMVSEEVMVIQLDNSQNKFWASQIPLLTEDLARARENDYTVLLFMHVPMATGDSTDTKVEALIGMDNTSNNFYNGGVIKESTNSDTKSVCDLITTHADVIKGIFTGHMHSDYYTEVQATDANGDNTYIPQYVLTGNFYGKGHVLKITVQ